MKRREREREKERERKKDNGEKRLRKKEVLERGGDMKRAC